MADMAEMEMPLPDNTIPMMTGQGPFGSVEMGGMFSVLKVRADQPAGDYKDPGWFKHPTGTVATQYVGLVREPARTRTSGGQSMPRVKAGDKAGIKDMEVQIRKPANPSGHSNH